VDSVIVYPSRLIENDWPRWGGRTRWICPPFVLSVLTNPKILPAERTGNAASIGKTNRELFCSHKKRHTQAAFIPIAYYWSSFYDKWLISIRKITFYLFTLSD